MDYPVKEIRAILNGDRKKVREQLDALLNQDLYPNQERLVKWMIDLFVSGNKISTLKRYLSDVGNDFIASTRDTEFLGWTKHDYHYVYNDILANKNQSRMGFTTTIICSLHSSLKKYYQAPDIDLKGGGDPQIVLSYLIPSHVYQLIQRCISAQEELSAYNQQAIGVVITLLYRTGMRISEILGLQVKDVEYDLLIYFFEWIRLTITCIV
ncbi:site-specific integrase [Psychrobacter frigidicola]|uniref:site-specific integrase n=1 Tax=Psychrobacter frigidicola TaxID=45611 RepID=UPI00191953BC|nr:site-specific integrase [Psychrobacter frigidicola]